MGATTSVNSDVRIRLWTVQTAEDGVYDVAVHGYEPTWPGPVPPPVHSYEPTDTDVRLEQLKTLAALRESGALTDAEFEAEKRRILRS